MPFEESAILPLASAPLVLVVDDELTPRSIVCRMVRTLGYGARSCAGGRAALRFLEAHRGEARLLLADLGMPRMDGGELAERARDLDPHLRVVLMVSPGDPYQGELLSGYRDLPCLAKPVNFGDLAITLEREVGPPARFGRAPLSLEPSRSRRRRRSSGHHET
jgi:two-component system, NtrC family, response regulator AtoC